MKFATLIQVTEFFADKETCINYLAQARWGDGPVCCTFCEHNTVYELKGKFSRYKCAKCRKHFSATKGTIFENSPIPLQKWFVAVYLLTAHKKGVSSVQLAADLGVTQKTAWFMAQRIRYALQVKSFDAKMCGMVQADETFIGGKMKNKHAHKKTGPTRGVTSGGKTPVVGVVTATGTVRTQVVEDTKARTLVPFIRKHVAPGTILVTDEKTGYKGLASSYKHVVITHAEGEYVRGAFDGNRIEGFWSLLKRGIVGIYHQVSPKHLHRYCDEFSFRYNSRKVSNEQRFRASMTGIGCRLTYRDLVGGVN